MRTKPFCAGDLSTAQVLVIGHDPRLQRSDTQAEYAFFGDYYFRPIPTQSSEKAKYGLAESVFAYVKDLTGDRYSAEQIVLTNLCNTALPHAPKGKTVFIPEELALTGASEIKQILDQSGVEIILVMSQQVNYWLQKLSFYPPVPEFLRAAEPKARGVEHDPPYYEPSRGRAFTLICGQCFPVGSRRLFPVLHVKNWPLRGRFVSAYAKAHENVINQLKI